MGRSLEEKKGVPVIDCPNCGAKDIPLSHIATMVKKGYPDIEIWECSACGAVPNLGSDVPVKRYTRKGDRP